jgi:uncharacterized protein
VNQSSDDSSAAVPAPHWSPVPARPVEDAERVRSVDTLRGMAVLGILAMNIVSFALPMVAYINPMSAALEPYAGPLQGANRVSWWIAHLVFDQKMMGLFSMLFGAGLVLMDHRRTAQAGGRKPRMAGVYYRRLLILFLIGMCHAYGLWYGDILVAYALCGLVLYPLRRLRPAALIAIGCVVFFIATPLSVGFGLLINLGSGHARELAALEEQGTPLTESQANELASWRAQSSDMDPGPEQVREQVERMRGSCTDVFVANAIHAGFMQTILFVTWSLWRGLGLMLMGMGLMKLGFFAASLSARAYLRIAAAGYLVGLPLVVLGALDLMEHRFDMGRLYLVSGHFNYYASVPVLLAHASLLLWCVKTGRLPGLMRRLASVGQMALTNYLAQTVVCTTLFFGWGFGRFGMLDRTQLWLVVAGVWALQLVASPWWLARFRFGPAEWVWRTLTYLRVQPVRRERPLA